MLNKKLLAVSVAAFFTASANAAVDLNATGNAISFPSYGSEGIQSGDLDDGFLEVTDAGSAGAIDATVKAGFGIPLGTTYYIRLDIANGRFSNTTAPSLAIVRAASSYTNPVAITRLSGGGEDATSAVYSIETGTGTDDDVTDQDVITVTIQELDISTSAAATLTYTLHETLTSAVNNESALVTTGNTIASVSSAVNSARDVVSNNVQAIVTKEFKEFTGGARETLGALAVTAGTASTDYLDTDFLDADSSALVLTDVLSTGQKAIFEGDFSFGEWWHTTSSANCANAAPSTANLTFSEDNSVATTVADIDITSNPVYLCIDNSDAKDVILRGSYSVSAEDDALAGNLGAITYDTTSIAIPYLTTFSSYNQRVYIINKGSSEAPYSISFRSEDGVTAVAGPMGTGTVPANSVLAIKASDLATLTGKTRTSATIEIEASAGNINATTQTVNLSDGSTDTVDLVVTQ